MRSRFASLLLAASFTLALGHPGRGKPLPARGKSPPAEKKPAHLDRSGDPLPAGALARLGTLRLRRPCAIHAVAFSPDGKILASGDGLGGETVSLWEVKSGKELRPLGNGRRNGVFCFAPDGKTLASGDIGNSPTLWEVATGKEIRRFRKGADQDEHLSTGSLAFSPDGKVLAAGDTDGRIILWKVATGQEIRTLKGQAKWVDAVAFSRDGKTLVSGSWDHTTRVWQWATGKELRKHPGQFGGLSPHGKILATFTDRNPGKGTAHVEEIAPDMDTVHVWEMATGKELRRFRGSASIISGAFAPDNKTLAVVDFSDPTIRLWNTRTGKPAGQLHGNYQSAFTVAFSPDGNLLASAGKEVGGSPVRLWEVASGKRLHQGEGHENPVTSLAFSPDGQTLASGSGDGTVRLWTVAAGKLQRSFTEHRDVVWSVAFSPDGKTLASESSDRTIRLWEPDTGKQRLKLQTSYFFDRVAFSPDGRLLTSTIVDGKYSHICLWESNTGKEIRRFGKHEGGTRSLAFSPDSRFVAWAGYEGSFDLWDVATGKKVCRFRGHTFWLTSVAFAPDGKALASGSEDATVRFWETATGKELFKIESPGKKKVGCVAFSPGGRVLAWGAEDGVVHLWEVASGKEILRLKGHAADVNAIAFSPDGKLLASGSNDTTILLWSLAESARQGLLPRATARDLEVSWRALAGTDAPVAYRAVWALAGTPRPAVRLLQKRLRPAVPVSAERLEELIADLDNARFAVRRRAACELQKLGELVVPALRKISKRDLSVEVKHRISQLLRKLESSSLSPDQLREDRALAVLEYVGSPEARQVLQALARGAPEARRTREARAALKRLARRPASAP
jgi:WD40 repeat protein